MRAGIHHAELHGIPFVKRETVAAIVWVAVVAVAGVVSILAAWRDGRRPRRR